jgi:hypothetical protein
MKTRYNSVTKDSGNTAVCLPANRRLNADLGNIKRELSREFGSTLNENNRLLSSALNEAEALAWNTGIPHLFFPVLAEEKVASARKWAVRQRLLRQNRGYSLAA